MIFKKLILNNFKSHKNSVIEFNKGTTIVVGENGAGKSSIFEAISFVLFRQHQGKKQDDLVRSSESNISMNIKLEFIVGNKTYLAERSRGRTSKAKLSVLSNDEYVTIVEGDALVDKEIQSILQLDANLFLNAIYVQQGEIAELVNKAPSQRKQLIGKLLGVDTLEIAWKNSLEVINKYNEKRIELQTVASQGNDIEEEIKEIVTKIKSYEKIINNQGKELQEVTNTLQEKKSLYEKEKELKNLYDKWGADCNNTMEKIKNLEKQLKENETNLNNILEKEKQLEILEQNLQDFDKLLSLKETIDELEGIQEHIDEVSKEYDYIQKEQKNKKTLENSYTIYNSYNYLNNKLEKETTNELYMENELVKKRDSLRAMVKSRSDTEGRILSFVKKLNEFYNYTVDKDNFMTLADQIVSDLNNAQHRIDEKNKEYWIIKTNKSSIQSKIGECETSIQDLKDIDICPTCSTVLTINKKKELIVDYKETIKQHEKNLEELNERSIQLEIDITTTKEKQSTLEKLNNNMKSCLRHHEDLIREKEAINNLKEEVAQDMNILDRIREKKALLYINQKTQEQYKKDNEKYIDITTMLSIKPSLSAIKKEIDLAKEDFTKKESEISEYDQKTIENLDDKINELKEIQREADKYKGMIYNKNNLKDVITELKKQLNTEQQEYDLLMLQKPKTSNTDIEKLANEVTTIESSKFDLGMKLSQNKGELSEVINYQKDLEKKESSIIDAKNRLEKVQHYIEFLNEIRDSYSKDGLQKTLRLYSKPLIEKNTKKFFNQFNFNYSDLRIDDEYSISVFGPEGESSLDMISGGEKIAIALALRLGITHSLAKGSIETILLDEPTIHLDENRRMELVELLSQLSVLPQMIIVTHDGELENAADNIIKVKKINGISSIK